MGWRILAAVVMGQGRRGYSELGTRDPGRRRPDAPLLGRPVGGESVLNVHGLYAVTVVACVEDIIEKRLRLIRYFRRLSAGT
jgi:hypothetical protein